MVEDFGGNSLADEISAATEEELSKEIKIAEDMFLQDELATDSKFEPIKEFAIKEVILTTNDENL